MSFRRCRFGDRASGNLFFFSIPGTGRELSVVSRTFQEEYMDRKKKTIFLFGLDQGWPANSFGQGMLDTDHPGVNTSSDTR